ncbi:MAG TPA: hypothetical protein ENJ60_07030 [Aeromonadales bacterium]|nr:hypothetical protein [Aeromonadales bacterium]
MQLVKNRSLDRSLDNEQLSSLMDNELSGQHCSDSLDLLSQCSQSRQTWARYHLVRELLIEENIVLTDDKFSESIASAIAEEPHRIGSTRWLKKTASQQSEKSWWKQAVGFGVAASVTALIITGVKNPGPDLETGVPSQQLTSHLAPIVGNVIPASMNHVVSQEAPSLDDKLRLQRLFLQHTMRASENGLKGIFPYAKVVSYRRIPTQVTKIENPVKKQFMQRSINQESQSGSKDIDSSKQP